ncbi:MAG: hypothetical protein J6Y25_06925 [Elusimicrobiaceae bacterium]|nr:hypothetical protein [Elusimicrobiaceae bacterium]MBP5617264.1 hypothetical protein [Elusimicrobiaceae bacterium]
MKPTLAQQSAKIAFGMFFSGVKLALVALILVVAVLAIGQSRVAPVSMHLLTTYAMEYAVTSFKPYRGYFPAPYPLEFDTK